VERTKANLKAWMALVEVPVPMFLRETGHKAMIYREPYGVSLIMGPFNGPLLLLLRPAITALAAGNTCILKVSEAPATATLLLDLVPKYFEPGAFTALAASRDQAAALLRLPFDFIFFTGSARVGRIVMRAAAENLTWADRTRRWWTSRPTFGTPPRRSAGEQQHGVVSGAHPQDTPMFTSPSPKSSSPSASERSPSFMEANRRTIPTIRGSSTPIP
jgi:hypothetical protein